VLRLIEALDGHLARVRLPGGFIDGSGLLALTDAASDLGDGRLELTSRGNVQLRGLHADAGVELGRRLSQAGLWPSESHELVRNVVASPMAGLDRDGDLAALVRQVDRSLCQDDRLAALSGRFLFAIDDGRGDVASLGPDVLAVVDHRRAWVEATEVDLEDVPDAMIQFARAFLDERDDQLSTAWRIEELTDGRERVRSRVGGGASIPLIGPTAPPIGRIAQVDGRTALVVAPPLGRLTRDQARWIAGQLGGSSARITPWRSVVLPDRNDIDALESQAIAEGLVITATSAWFGVSACAGRPRCDKALADVQHDASTALGRWPGQRVHWSGCERRCGRPKNTEVDLVATTDGYQIMQGSRTDV
jgi:precorrin-3B synthase